MLAGQVKTWIRPIADHSNASGTTTRPARVAALLLLGGFAAFPALGQVASDGTLGANGAGLVSNSLNSAGGIDFVLDESDGQLVGGTNLFHSLSNLDLGSYDSLTYEGAPTIENLITRITGGRSSIDGLIRSDIPGANLFLVNPDGIIFGESATLDVSGSVVVSSAHEIELGTTGRFDTRAAGGDILTVDAPERFGFLAPPAPIIVAGSQIQGADGESLALIGGDIRLSGGRTDNQPALLSVRGGRIDLASLRSTGTVRIQNGSEPDLILEGVAERGEISISDNFVVSTSGVALNPLAELPVPGSGPIFIRAKDLLVEDSEIRALTVTNQAASDISIDLTGDLIVRGLPGQLRAFINSGSDLTLAVPPDLTIVSQTTTIVPGLGLILDVFFCQGNIVCGANYRSGGAAGNIEIVAHHVQLEGGGQIVSRSEFGGDAGRIDLVLAGDLEIGGISGDGARSGLFSNAEGAGNPGTISLRLPRGVLRIDDFGVIVIENGEGSIANSLPGRIKIEAGALEMSGNARIDSSTRGAGPGGEILIDVDGLARLRGRQDSEEFTGITSLSQPGSTGAAGTITMSARSVEILDGAEISARPVGGSALGDAGNIQLTVEETLILNASTISTQSALAAGGNIQIAAGRYIDLQDSSITTSVTQGAAAGGNIRIEPGPAVVILDRSQIVARADLGAGGEIFIATGALIRDDVSIVSASSNFGVDGTTVIESPQGEINVHQPELSIVPVDASALLDEPCAARNPSAASTLVIDPDHGPLREDSDVSPAFLGNWLGTENRDKPVRGRSKRSSCAH